MVTDVQNELGTDRLTLRYLVRCMVEQSGAVRADQIARRMSVDIAPVCQELEYWVAKGLVEVLRPVAVSMTEECEDASAEGGAYYRWVRPTDTEYAWQAALMRHRPLPHIADSYPIIF